MIIGICRGNRAYCDCCYIVTHSQVIFTICTLHSLENKHKLIFSFLHQISTSSLFSYLYISQPNMTSCLVCQKIFKNFQITVSRLTLTPQHTMKTLHACSINKTCIMSVQWYKLGVKMQTFKTTTITNTFKNKIETKTKYNLLNYYFILIYEQLLFFRLLVYIVQYQWKLSVWIPRLKKDF